MSRVVWIRQLLLICSNGSLNVDVEKVGCAELRKNNDGKADI